MTASQRAAAADDLFEPSFADEPAFVGGALPGQSGPIDTRSQPRTGRRLEMLRGGGREAVGPRVTPGQLPTYERSFLQEELRRIALITGGLLGVIIGLTLFLR